MRETPNLYLSACLVMVGIRVLTVPCNTPILSLRRMSLDRYETLQDQIENLPILT
jgi:hypothetical protein